MNPKGSRSENPQRSISRDLWLWAETDPDPHSLNGKVQTDSRVIQSGTFTETLLTSLTLSWIGKPGLKKSKKVWISGQGKNGKRRLSRRRRGLLYFCGMHVCFMSMWETCKSAVLLSVTRKGKEITVHSKETVLREEGVCRHVQGSYHALKISFFVCLVFFWLEHLDHSIYK